MRSRILIIDAFADRPMTGNPAAVCPLTSWLPDEVMQGIAAEMNLSETVFVVRTGDHYEIRWFTPTREVDLVGHATLAAGAFILGEDATAHEVRFTSKSGPLRVRRATEGFVLDMPALRPTARPDWPPLLGLALGQNPDEVLAAKHYLCVYSSAAAVADLRPDFAALASLDLPAVIVTAPGTQHFDFVSRFFAPANGVPEDPVSGVAHCCLAPYWSARLGKQELLGRQLSQRGGVIHCTDRGDRVDLAGNVAIFLDGSITF